MRAPICRTLIASLTTLILFIVGAATAQAASAATTPSFGASLAQGFPLPSDSPFSFAPNLVTASPDISGPTQTFNYTGAAQTYTVPTGDNALQVTAIGGKGGNGNYSGGVGGKVTSTIPVTPGETLYVYVGGNGTGGASAPGGFNGGGAGSGYNYGSSGGGASDIRTAAGDLTTRLIVAGGGGGGGSYIGGGNAGYPVGTNGGSAMDGNGGTGGTEHKGGEGGWSNVGGSGGNGTFGQGGAAGLYFYPPYEAAGAGGGGWYGGAGGGSFAGGGGGSDYVAPGAEGTTYTTSSSAAQVVITPESSSISVSPDAQTWGYITPGTITAPTTFTVTNHDLADTTIDGATISGASAGSFAIGANTCTAGLDLTPGASCTLNVAYTGANSTAYGELDVTSSTGEFGANLVGNPPPTVTPSASLVDFGTVGEGSSATRSFTLTNTEPNSLPLTPGAATTGGDFAISNDGCKGQTLAYNQSCTITAKFTPTSAGTLEGARVTIPVNDQAQWKPNPQAQQVWVTLNGTGQTVPLVSGLPSAYGFGGQVETSDSGPHTFTVTNSGGATLDVGKVTLTGTNPDQFSLSNDTCSNATVAPGNSCTVQAQFDPTTTGALSATLNIPSNAASSPDAVALTGTGLLPPVVKITTPSERQHVLLGSTVTPSFTCVDSNAGDPTPAAITSCTSTGMPTDALGPHAFTVTGTDTDGVSTSQTVAYVVDPAKYGDLIMGGNPIAYWRMNDALGASTMKDSSGNGNNGTYFNYVATHRTNTAIACEAAITPVACATAGDSEGYSAFFPARDGYAAVNNITAPTQGYTIEAWVDPANGSNMSIAGQGGAGQLFIQNGHLALRQTQDTLVGTSDAAAVPAGKWSFVAGTWDGSETDLYVNGQLVASSGSDNKAPSGSATFYVGYGDQAPWMHGNLDEVAYFDHAVSAADLATAYADATATDQPSLGHGNLDTALPTVVLSTPADGSTYTATKVPTAAFSCTDINGASWVASCNATVDGQPLSNGDQLPSSAGPHTVTVTATDTEGLTATVSHTYTVEGYAQVVLSDSPLAYWRLGDAASSSTMADSSGNGHDGIYVNDQTQGPVGISGDGDATRQMLGDGGYGYVNNIAAPKDAYTVEAWADPADTGDMSIFTAAGDLYLRNGHYVFQQGTTVLTDPNAAQANVWTQLIGTWDGQTATLYDDGVAVASAESTDVPSGAATVYVGYGDQAPWMRGNLDEVAYYDHALSAQRVWEHFIADPPAAATTTTTTADPAPVTTTDPATTSPAPVASSTDPVTTTTAPAQAQATPAATAATQKAQAKPVAKKKRKAPAKKRKVPAKKRKVPAKKAHKHHRKKPKKARRSKKR